MISVHPATASALGGGRGDEGGSRRALGAGGEEGPCGWLKDRYGVSWQVFPRRLTELTLHVDRRVSAKAFAAMMKQKKIEIADIEVAVRT